jgi:hypothetical protein
MKIKTSLAAVAALALAASLFSATSAFAVGTLDQSNSNDGEDGVTIVYVGTDPAQLFTAGISGELDRVTLDLSKNGSTGSFYVEIFATTLGVKTGTALASESRPDSDIPNLMGNVTIDFTTPALVTAGTVYALVLRAPNTDMDAIYWGYGAGQQFFATYVTPSSAGTNSDVTAGVTAGVRSAGLTTAEYSAVPFSHALQSIATDVTLSVDDLTGANAGWNVTVSSSVLTWTASSGGPLTGSDLPASALAVTAAGPITTVSGDVWTGETGLGALGTPLNVFFTNYGNGAYTVPLTLTLTIPGQASVGAYAGTLTTTISAAP